jgi:hypothetical protein
MAKGYNQSDIAKELHTTRNTVMRDIKEINEWTRKGLYDMAKQSLSTMLYSCLIGLNEAEKEAWKIYKNPDNDPEINHWHKINALRLLTEINRSKFRMFGEGPTIMELDKLRSKLEMIKDNVFKDNNFRPFIKPASNSNLPNPNTDVEDLKGELNKIKNMDEKEIKRQELERLGVPYEIIKEEEEEETDNNEEAKDEGMNHN